MTFDTTQKIPRALKGFRSRVNPLTLLGYLLMELEFGEETGQRVSYCAAWNEVDTALMPRTEDSNAALEAFAAVLEAFAESRIGAIMEAAEYDPPAGELARRVYTRRVTRSAIAQADAEFAAALERRIPDTAGVRLLYVEEAMERFREEGVTANASSEEATLVA